MSKRKGDQGPKPIALSPLNDVALALSHLDHCAEVADALDAMEFVDLNGDRPAYDVIRAYAVPHLAHELRALHDRIEADLDAIPEETPCRRSEGGA